MFKFEDNVFQSMLSKYERSEKDFQEDIETVKKWIQSQPHLPEVMEDDKIKNFLLLNKCSVEKTKEKIDNYYTMRTLIPEMYLDVDSPEIQKSVEISYWLALPKLTEDLCRVMVLRLRKKDMIDELYPATYHARLNHLQEIRLKEDLMFKDTYIVDMDGYTWGYVLKNTPSVTTKIVTFFERVYSNRVQAIYIINPVSTIEHVLNTLKGIIKAKIFQRIHICKDSKILLEVFPKEIMPKDYGGDELSLEELHDLQNRKIFECKEWLGALNRLRADETLRPEKLKNDYVLGFHGNFKKLNVD